MRRLIFSIFTLFILFFGAFYNTAHLHRVTDQMASVLQEAESNVSKGDWNSAITKTQYALDIWTQWEPYLYVILQHKDTDEILLSFYEVKQLLLAQENGGEYFAANARLIAQIKLLHEMEVLSLKNLL